MKKVKTAAALLCSACLVLSGTAVPTMADSVKVVTLGAGSYLRPEEYNDEIF